MRLIVFVLALLVSGISANSQDNSTRWVWRTIGWRTVCDEYGWNCRRIPVRQRHYAAPVYGYVQQAPYDTRRRPECLVQRAAVGLEKLNLDEARQSAIGLWMEAVQLHEGKRWMNPDNAIVLSNGGRGPDCYLSATGNRFSEKAAEATSGRVLHQCEFIARPCAGTDDERRR